MKFRELSIGQRFDFIEDGSIYNSFYKTCTKIGPRKYRDDEGQEYRVGSINCTVHHVEPMPANVAK